MQWDKSINLTPLSLKNKWSSGVHLYIGIYLGPVLLQTICADMEAMLVEITDEEENMFIASYADRMNSAYFD